MNHSNRFADTRVSHTRTFCKYDASTLNSPHLPCESLLFCIENACLNGVARFANCAYYTKQRLDWICSMNHLNGLHNELIEHCAIRRPKSIVQALWLQLARLLNAQLYQRHTKLPTGLHGSHSSVFSVKLCHTSHSLDMRLLYFDSK